MLEKAVLDGVFLVDCCTKVALVNNINANGIVNTWGDRVGVDITETRHGTYRGTSKHRLR